MGRVHEFCAGSRNPGADFPALPVRNIKSFNPSKGAIVETTAPAEERGENIMGTMEINPLLVKLSVPMMISMLVQALYNVVDSVFVSHVERAP